MKFTKAYMQDEAFDNCIEDNIVDQTRWSTIHEMIFKYEGKFYRTSYSKGSTESQCESPFEYDDEEIECEEVHQVERMVKVWEKVDASAVSKE